MRRDPRGHRGATRRLFRGVDSGTSIGELSRLLHHELGVAPDRCRLIGHLTPALREPAHTTEQVAQFAYQLGYNLHAAFDNRFKEGSVGPGPDRVPRHADRRGRRLRYRDRNL